MAYADAKYVVECGNQALNDRLHILSLWQEMASNFYPERADFTQQRMLGEDFASHLTTSKPVLVRRSFADSIGSMLRPRGQTWFHASVMREEMLDNAARQYLEFASSVMRRAMYDRQSQFMRATKEGDNDFATFGQAVISVEADYKNTTILYRCWHLRDVAWTERASGMIGQIHRKWKMTARQMIEEFGEDNVHEEVRRKAKDHKKAKEKIEGRHSVFPADEYDMPEEKKRGMPFISVFVDVQNEHVISEKPVSYQIYCIPRWQTVSGSPYAFSPATVAGLADARLLQAMTLSMLEAGEKAANPPMVATQEAVRSDFQMFAGGITWVDAEYDERLGDALRPMTIDRSGLGFAQNMLADTRAMLEEAFYLNRLNLPIMAGDMTATEVSQRVQEYIRNALPLFEPLESDYNGQLCEMTFEVLQSVGGFGSIDQIPDSLAGQDVRFIFESPLHEAEKRQAGQKMLEAKALIAEAAALDRNAAGMLDVRTALRDALEGVGVPARWTRDEESMQMIDQAMAEREQQQQLLEAMQQGGAAAEQIGRAGQALGLTGAV